MTWSKSTIAPRGAQLANVATSTKNTYKLLKDEYHPINNPEGIINLAVSENVSVFVHHSSRFNLTHFKFAMLDDVTEFFANAKLDFLHDSYTYKTGPWGSGRLRALICGFLNEHARPSELFSAHDVFCTNGVTSAMELSGFTLFEPGGGILLTRPSYAGFHSSFTLKAKVQMVYVQFGSIDPLSTDAIPQYEEAFETAKQKGIKIRALTICHPHNPLGRCYSKDSLIALMNFCQRHEIHLISDEIYLLSTYQGEGKGIPFQSVFSFDSSAYIDPKYLHMLYGMSKDFAASGLRLGFFLSKNQDLLSATAALASFHWVNPITDIMACTMLENKQWLNLFLTKSKEQLQRSNDIARAVLDAAEIKYERRAMAGFFLWLDCGLFLPKDAEDKWLAEMELFEKVAKHGVGIVPGQASQYAEDTGHFRMVFFHPEDVLKLALKRLITALKGQDAVRRIQLLN